MKKSRLKRPESNPPMPAAPPTDALRDALLEQALPDVAFEGWDWALAKRAAAACGYEPTMALAVFPGGLADFVGHVSDWADRRMLNDLADVDIGGLRVRDRIHLAAMTRLRIMAPHKEAVRRTMTYWSVPPRGIEAGRLLWRTADRIWDWAGDSSTDYNRYTKRSLLSGVLSATMLAWMNDDSSGLETTSDFLTRRIENVLRLGQIIGKFKKTG